MTQYVLKVLFGNASILLKVLSDFYSILCERVMPQYIVKYKRISTEFYGAGFWPYPWAKSISRFLRNTLAKFKGISTQYVAKVLRGNEQIFCVNTMCKGANIGKVL